MYRPFISQHFKREIKSLAKKYPSLLDDVIVTLSTFDKRANISLGAGIYKIRMKSSQLPKGKGGAFRIIILLIEIDAMIAPITIYFKSDKANITKKEIVFHANLIRRELGLNKN